MPLCHENVRHSSMPPKHCRPSTPPKNRHAEGSQEPTQLLLRGSDQSVNALSQTEGNGPFRLVSGKLAFLFFDSFVSHPCARPLFLASSICSAVGPLPRSTHYNSRSHSHYNSQYYSRQNSRYTSRYNDHHNRPSSARVGLVQATT